jgi:hypothetical protein
MKDFLLRVLSRFFLKFCYVLFQEFNVVVFFRVRKDVRFCLFVLGFDFGPYQ